MQDNSMHDLLNIEDSDEEEVNNSKAKKIDKIAQQLV